MDGKYKIYLGCNEEKFIQVVAALIDSGVYVFSYMRCKTLKEIRHYYGSPRDGNLHEFLSYSEWMVIGYHEECKRTIAAVASDWCRIREFQEITFEDFLKLIEKEKEEENASRRLHSQV